MASSNSSWAFPSTTSSSSRSSSSTPSFLRKLIFKRPTPSSSAMPSPSSSSSDRAQQPVRRIVHRPAAPSLGPLSKPHSEWRAQRSEDDEWRGRSGRRKTLRFDLPTPSTLIPIPSARHLNTRASSTSTSDQHDELVPSQRDQSVSSLSSFEPSSPPASSLDSFEFRISAARSTSATSSASYSTGSAAFYDRDDDDSSASSSSAFSFIDGEDMEELDEKTAVGGSGAKEEVEIRKASSDSYEEEGAFDASLHFARKPSLISHPSSSPQVSSSSGLSLPSAAASHLLSRKHAAPASWQSGPTFKLSF